MTIHEIKTAAPSKFIGKGLPFCYKYCCLVGASDGFLEIGAGEDLIGLQVFLGSFLDDVFRNLRRRGFLVPATADEPVAQELLVVALLRTADLILVSGPETTAVRREHLICQGKRAVLVNAELELGIGDDDAFCQGIVGALGVELETCHHELCCQGFSQHFDGFIKVDVLVMSLSCFGRGGVDGRREFFRFPEPAGQTDTADRTILLIARPARASDIATNDALDGEHLELFHQHTTVGVLIGMEHVGHFLVLDGDHVIGNDLLGCTEPERRESVENSSFVGNSGGHDTVERGNPVRRDKHQVVTYIVDVPNLALGDLLHRTYHLFLVFVLYSLALSMPCYKHKTITLYHNLHKM